MILHVFLHLVATTGRPRVVLEHCSPAPDVKNECIRRCANVSSSRRPRLVNIITINLFILFFYSFFKIVFAQGEFQSQPSGPFRERNDFAQFGPIHNKHAEWQQQQQSQKISSNSRFGEKRSMSLSLSLSLSSLNDD
jgi:hypothetical protein